MPRVAILAGGLATRLRPLTETQPKAMVDINGEPFIAHQLRLLRQNEVEDVVLCLGHLGEQVANYVEDGEGFGLRVRCSFDGPRLLGTAGALKRAIPLLGDVFFVMYGDSYLPCDYRLVRDHFELVRQPALMTVFRNEGRWDRSNVAYCGHRIVAYNKASPNPRMRHIDYGLGVFRSYAFDRISEDRPSDLATLYQELLADGQLAGLEVTERFYEIGSPTGLAELRKYLASGEKPERADER